jgi:hypothetical protein
MIERGIVVLGGILSIYLGYRLFALGITEAQGSARAFGIELLDFGPGLFFAGLGAYVLVRALGATIRTGGTPASAAAANEAIPSEAEPSPQSAAPAATFFFGVEDPTRRLGKWSAKSFFLETRDLLRALEGGGDATGTEALRQDLAGKLESITMTPEEYQRYQVLTNKAELVQEEQQEFLELEGKLFP